MCVCVCGGGGGGGEGILKKHVRVLIFSTLFKTVSCNVWARYFCVEFHIYPLIFPTEYLAHTLKDIQFIERWQFKNSRIYEPVSVLRRPQHYDDVIMTAIASQITSITIVYSTVYSSAHKRKHQSPASLAFVQGFHRGPVNSPHKWPVTRKMFPFDDVITNSSQNNVGNQTNT